MRAHLDASAAGELGDPARIHTEGMTTRAGLEDARDRVAHWLGVRARQVVFTSGATESIAAAHYGACARTTAEGRDTAVLTAVEHSSVMEQSRRGRHIVVPVDGSGRVEPEAVADGVDASTAVVHIQWANHESGVVQPVAEAIDALSQRAGGTGAPLVHVDAAQAGPSMIDAVACGADLLSISGHKLGGPPGVGVLVVRRNLRIPSLLLGGDQERARRAGMENVAAISGLAAVADHLRLHGAQESERMCGLSRRIIDWTHDRADVEVLGDRHHRAPHLVCLQLSGVEPQPVLLRLDQMGIAVHSGSSCSSEAFEPSPVLAAMGVEAQRSLRISVGWSTTEADIESALDALDAALGELQALGTRS